MQRKKINQVSIKIVKDSGKYFKAKESFNNHVHYFREKRNE